MSYSATVVLDSMSACGSRLVTLEVSFPRIVLAEFNTHRMFSRNSASSRAIPFPKMLERVENDPFVPGTWGKNQKGMQAEQDVSLEDAKYARLVWNAARNDAIKHAEELHNGVGIHKQIVNRLIEPFLFHTVVFSTTELGNWFGLRDSKLAQPEIMHAAKLMRSAIDRSDPQPLNNGEWHLPYVTHYDYESLRNAGYSTDQLALISSARCARVSYLTHDGERDVEKDMALAASLENNGHMSPFEHVAKSMDRNAWESYAGSAMLGWIYNRIPVGNFWGWGQYRKGLANEHDFNQRLNK